MRSFLHTGPAGALLAALALVAAAPAGALELSPSEQAGKRIFRSGESPSGNAIIVKLGRDGATLPGSAAPCSSCHGADGQGRPEGGVRPSSIIWSELAKPYGHVHDGGRKHPAFSDAGLARALRDGVDPAGNPLDVSMPRFVLSGEDLANLAAYLRRVEEDLDPGIDSTVLRIGTILPTSGALADVGLSMRAVLTAWFGGLNRRGGIHGRKVELVVAGYDSDRDDGLDAARALLREDRVFALVSGFFPAAEEEVASLVGAARVPMVGPFSLFARNDDASRPWIFHPAGGLREQARALAAFALQEHGTGARRFAVVHSPEAPYVEAASSAAAWLRKRGAPPPELLGLSANPRGTADRLRAGAFDAVLVLAGDDALSGLVHELPSTGRLPPLLASGTLAGRAATRVGSRYPGPVFLAFPGSPSDETVSASRELARLREEAGTARLPRTSQASAVVDAIVLVEGLKRVGRALSRDGLVAGLEALHAFETGLSPPVSFGPDRRVGTLGAYVVRLEPGAQAFVPVGAFVAAD